MINDNDFVAKGLNVSTRTIDSIAYIYLEDRKEFLKLNEVGSFIWSQINGVITVTDVIKECVQEYEADEKEITKSIFEFLDTLLQEQIIEVNTKEFKGGDEKCLIIYKSVI